VGTGAGATTPAGPGGRPWPRLLPDVAMAAGLATGALGLYAATLLPGVGYSGDTAKWQFIGRVGGTPHATGYPLFLAVDKAWVTAFPFGSLAWRVNLLSALFGAATVAVLALLLRQLGARRAVAAATAATFAVTLTFWSQAVVAEVYTLHLLLLASVTLCLARWRSGGSTWWLRAGTALLALSFGNHLGTVLAVPGVLWVVLSDWRRSLTVRNALWAAGCIAVGAGQYGYLLWTADVGRYAENRVQSWADVWGMVTGGPFRESMFTFGPRALVDVRLPMFARLAWREYFVLAVPAAYGAWVVLRAPGWRRHVGAQLLLLALAATVYALEFGVEDVFVFFLPLWLVVAVYLGLGIEGAAVAAGPRLRHAPVTRAALAGLLVVVPVALAAANHARAGERDDTAHAARIERLIDAAGEDALLVTDNYRDSEFIWYYLLGEDLGDRRDLLLGNQLGPTRVRRYVEGAALPAVAPAGLPVYTATPSQARDLADAGLTVTEVAPEVWRVEAPRASTTSQAAQAAQGR
jgi:hypothetical protein